MKLKVTIDGNVYEVEVEVAEDDQPHPTYVPPLRHGPAHQGPAPALPTASPSAPSQPVADESKVCRSPFAGTVSRVVAKAAQEIKANDLLIVLEAMKMETEITSPIAGKVAKINVRAGDAVRQGQVLVEFE